MSNSARLRQYVRIREYLASKGVYINYRKPFRCINPSHKDDKPSCVVFQNPSNDSIHCFGCGIHGDIFFVVGIMENLPSWTDQYKLLIKKYGHLI